MFDAGLSRCLPFRSYSCSPVFASRTATDTIALSSRGSLRMLSIDDARAGSPWGSAAATCEVSPVDGVAVRAAPPVAVRAALANPMASVVNRDKTPPGGSPGRDVRGSHPVQKCGLKARGAPTAGDQGRAPIRRLARHRNAQVQASLATSSGLACALRAKMAAYTSPAIAAPSRGASQNAHSCPSGALPAKIAGPVERA